MSQFFAINQSIAQIASLNLDKLQVPQNTPSPTLVLLRVMTQIMHMLGNPPARCRTGANISTGLLTTNVC
jgi:hypothetical protein